METVGRGPDSTIASGSASATGVSLAVAPPSKMTWRTNSNVSTGVRKTNCACAKIIVVRNFATSRKIAVLCSTYDYTCAHARHPTFTIPGSAPANVAQFNIQHKLALPNCSLFELDNTPRTNCILSATSV